MTYYYSDWSNLHSELVDEIIHRLIDPIDFICFSSVCRSWRSLSRAYLRRHRQCRRPHRRSQIPWILLPSNPNPFNKNLPFYSLTRAKTYHVPTASAARLRCVGSSSEGFLITADDTAADLHVTNPLTGAHLPLPPTATLPGVLAAAREDPFCPARVTSYELAADADDADVSASHSVGLQYMRRNYFAKAIITSPWDPSSSSAAAVVHGELGSLAFAKPGDASWTPIDCPADEIEEIIFHRGRRLHVITEMGMLVFDLDRPSDCPLLIADPLPPVEEDDDDNDEEAMPTPTSRYLAESLDGDDLFLVIKIYEDEGEVTTDFVVFKFDEDRSDWNKMESLGDAAIFLGQKSLFTICEPESESPFPMKNCIYFLNDFDDGIGVFNMGDSCITRLKLRQNLRCQSLVWFTPSLL